MTKFLMQRTTNNHRSFIRFLIILFIVLGLIHLPSYTQAQNIDPKFQSVLIYGISRKIQWSSGSDVFRIGIVGNNDGLSRELKKLAGTKQIGSKDVRIEELSSANGTLDQDIIFISTGSKGQLQSAISNVSGNTLILSAFSGGLDQGSHINFFQVGNKIAFGINKTSIDATNLRVMSDLVRLASETR